MSDYSRRNTMGGSGGSGGSASGADASAGTPPTGESPVGPRVISQNGVTHLFTANSVATEALSELKTEGYSREFTGNMNIIQNSDQVINALGFTIVEKEELSPGIDVLSNYSLIGSTNVDETIKNSRIVDPDLDKLTPVKTMTTDKFKSEADSFYELDDERSESVKNAVEKEKNKTNAISIKIANRLAPIVRSSPNKMLHSKTARGLLKR